MAIHSLHYSLNKKLGNSDKRDTQLNLSFKGPDGNNLNLTRRETDILIQIVLGHTAKETGLSLGISFRTVEAYIDTLKLKLGCHSKREIIEMMIKTGVILQLGLITS